MESLAETKENFLFISRKGWFLPNSVPTHAISEPDARGGSLGYREAAVLCLICHHRGKPHLLLTKRSSGISFEGDACLPGGSKDSGDASFVDTALREASEEVGLDRRQVEVVCSLPQQRTGGRVGLTVVTPVVALTRCTPEELGLSPNPAEVDCLYWVPLELFLTLQLGSDGQTSAWWYKAVFRFIDPETELMHVIYGLTSYICVSIAAIALNRRPNFTYLAHFISRVAKQGEMIASVHNTIALTRQEAEEIQLSKL